MHNRTPTGAERVLVLDVGSSSVRATFFDATGESLPSGEEMRRRYRWRSEPEGAMECEADRLLAEVEQVLDAAVAKARAERLEIVAVAIAAFWHSLMGLDRSGMPSTPVFGWGDTRASDTAISLRAQVEERAIHERTGCFLHPSYPLVRLVWLRSHDPDAFARTAAWVSFPEYLEERLLGVRRCSISMASGSGLLDVHRCDWDERAAEVAGIDPRQLSPLVDAHEAASGLRPEYAQRWPELAHIPWFPALGDGACANAGSGAVGTERFGVTVGTSAAVRALWQPGGRVSIPEALWCYRLDRRWWVAGGALSNGGNALDYLRRTLRVGTTAESDPRVGVLPPDGHGLTVLPFLRGERGPGWQMEREGVMVGMSDATRPEEILRAWMEAVAYRIARVAERLEEVGGPVREVVASGGALYSSPAWTQILADVLNRPVVLTGEREDTSRGAALMALRSLGLIEGLRELAPPVARRLEPDPDRHAVYCEAAARQQRLLEVLATWSDR